MAPTNVPVNSEHYYEFEGERGKLRITIPYYYSDNHPEIAGISVKYIEGPRKGWQHFTPEMWNRVILSDNPIGNAAPAAGGKRRKLRKSRKAKKSKRITRRR